MGVLLLGMACLFAVILLFAVKITAAFGFIVACATFSFPIGLIGLVGVGVSLLFILQPREFTD